MPGVSPISTLQPIGTIAAICVLTVMGHAGCSLAGDQILPANLQHRISSSSSTADDHVTAARFYQVEAQRLAAEAETYARNADKISPLEDTKGFRRNALKVAAQERQRQAQDMLQLVSQHQRNAEELTARHTQP